MIYRFHIRFSTDPKAAFLKHMRRLRDEMGEPAFTQTLIQIMVERGQAREIIRAIKERRERDDHNSRPPPGSKTLA
jgi:hypothetical protein